jgi:sugar phosphate isomerase/epimerase
MRRSLWRLRRPAKVDLRMPRVPTTRSNSSARSALRNWIRFYGAVLPLKDRVVIGDGDIPLRRLCGALADAGYDGWYDLELIGPAIEAEGYDAVVPRVVERFRGLWT